MKIKYFVTTLFVCILAWSLSGCLADDSGKYNLDNFGWQFVDSKGRGSLVFQQAPRGKSMKGHKFYTGDQIYVNLYWREDGYGIAYEDGEYGYVDASYIDWNSGTDSNNNGVYDEYGSIESGEYIGSMRIVNCESWVSLRAQPSTEANRLAQVPLGAVVDACYYNNVWMECNYNGMHGYILSDYLDLASSEAYTYEDNDYYDYDYDAVQDGILIDADSFPDPVFRSYIGRFDTNNSGSLDRSELESVEYIDVTGMGVEDLAGIEYFINLKELQCSDNQLMYLWLQSFANLEVVECQDCGILYLYLDQHPSLYYLDCKGNDLEALDISGCQLLVHLVEECGQPVYDTTVICEVAGTYMRFDNDVNLLLYSSDTASTYEDHNEYSGFDAPPAYGDHLGTMFVDNCDSWVSLREEADPNSTRLAKVPKGTVVEAYYWNGEYNECYYDNMHGFIATQYLSYLDEYEYYEEGYDDEEANIGDGDLLNPESIQDCMVYCNKSSNSMDITCRDALSNTVLWTYHTDVGYTTELTLLEAFFAGTTENPYVMVNNAEKGLTALELHTGRGLWTVPFGGASISYAVDEDGTLYIGGYYDTGVMAVSADGQVLRYYNCEDSNIYWLTGIELREGEVLVYYDHMNEAEDAGWVVYSLDGILLKYVANGQEKNMYQPANTTEEDYQNRTAASRNDLGIDEAAFPLDFSMGGFGWGAGVLLSADMSFTGDYHERDNAEWTYAGKFANIQKIDDYTYEMTVDGFTSEGRGDPVNVIGNGDRIRIYLPGANADIVQNLYYTDDIGFGRAEDSLYSKDGRMAVYVLCDFTTRYGFVAVGDAEDIISGPYDQQIPSEHLDYVNIGGYYVPTDIDRLSIYNTLNKEAVLSATTVESIHQYAVQTDIYSLDFLYHFRNLKSLTMIGFSFSDLKPLSVLPSIEEVWFGYDAISDLTPIKDLDLTVLSLEYNQIEDISPLAGMTRLRDLRLQRNNIQDISALQGLNQVTKLYLFGNQIQDISALAGMTALRELSLAENQITDISALSGLPNLYAANLMDNRITDIRPLSKLTSLQYLTLTKNPINPSDVDWLREQLLNCDIVFAYDGNIQRIISTDIPATEAEQESERNSETSSGNYAYIMEITEAVNDTRNHYMAGAYSSGIPDFEIFKVDLKTGNSEKVFSFLNDDSNLWYKYTYQFSNPFDCTILKGNQLRQLFNSDFSEFAVGFNETLMGHRRVGYIDTYGNLTDITEIVNPTSSDFSSTIQDHYSPRFLSDSRFFYFDETNRKYCYLDLSASDLTKKEPALYANKRPIWDPTFYPDGVRRSSDSSTLNALDYITNGNWLVFNDQKLGICQAWSNKDSDITYISPQTDYQISSGAYGDGAIAFIGSKGDGKITLFQMDLTSGNVSTVIPSLSDSFAQIRRNTYKSIFDRLYYVLDVQQSNPIDANTILERYGIKRDVNLTRAELAYLCAYSNEAAEQTNDATEMADHFYRLLQEHVPLEHPLHNVPRSDIYAFVGGTKQDMQAIVMLYESEPIVIFPGTHGWADIQTDAGLWSDTTLLAPLSAIDNAIYKVFTETQYEAARRLVDDLANTYDNIVVAGHSLGGHLAVMTALKCSGVTQCIAYDPPGRSDSILQDAFNSTNEKKIVNYCANGSLISKTGTHVGTVKYLTVTPNTSGADGVLGLILVNHGIYEIAEALGGTWK